MLYASFLSKEFDVLAIGISGEEEHRFMMSHYLHLKEDKKAYPLFDDVLLTVKEYFDGINQSNYKFNQDYAKLIAYTKTLNETLHAKKIKESQIIFVPGGFSGGDEPDGSGKFMSAFLRNGAIKNEVN